LLDSYRLPCFHHTVVDAANSETSEEVIVREIEGLELRRARECVRSSGWRHELKDGIEQRRKVDALVVEFLHSHTFAADSVYRTEIRLCVVCTKFKKQLKYCFFRLCRIGSWLIYFIQNDDWLDTKFKRLLEH